jgi:RND family efflux transporter MFP subunit
MLAMLAGGCHGESPPKPAASGAPTVRVIRPTLRTIDYVIDQPGFVDAYERTAIYSKVTGFIKHWDVDIGHEVKKGDLLAEIFVPELKEEHDSMVAQVGLGESNVKVAAAQLKEAQANVGKNEAEVVRWASEVTRLTEMVKENVVDKQVLAETQRQLDSSKAALAAANAAVNARAADLVSAQAKVKVAEADERKAAAMLAYTLVTAPYDGVVTVRNANTGDYVQGVAGDKSTPNPSALFVVARTDKVRIFVDVPEAYARYVQRGTKAMVRADALSGREISSTIIRTSWAIHENTRTLLAEIDLTRQEYDGLRPGMYVFVKVLVERPGVYALPPPREEGAHEALTVSGNQTYCFRLRGNKAIMTPVQAGLSDGTWMEVDRMKIDNVWRKVTGQEQVILGNLSELTDGQTVQVAPATSPGPH